MLSLSLSLSLGYIGYILVTIHVTFLRYILALQLYGYKRTFVTRIVTCVTIRVTNVTIWMQIGPNILLSLSLSLSLVISVIAF